MKKISIIFFLIMSAIIPISMQAQRGEKTLGIAGGYATYNKGGYTNLYFHYSFANHFRIAPDIGYVFKNEGCSAFIMDVDLHFPFRVARGLGVYPLVGFAFNNWSYSGLGHASRAGANFGGGLDIYITSNLKFSLQGKYSLMKDTDGGYIGLGIGYVF